MYVSQSVNMYVCEKLADTRGCRREPFCLLCSTRSAVALNAGHNILLPLTRIKATRCETLRTDTRKNSKNTHI